MKNTFIFLELFSNIQVHLQVYQGDKAIMHAKNFSCYAEHYQRFSKLLCIYKLARLHLVYMLKTIHLKYSEIIRYFLLSEMGSIFITEQLTVLADLYQIKFAYWDSVFLKIIIFISFEIQLIIQLICCQSFQFGKLLLLMLSSELVHVYFSLNVFKLDLFLDFNTFCGFYFARIRFVRPFHLLVLQILCIYFVIVHVFYSSFSI